MIYKMDFNTYLPKIYIFFSFRIKVGSESEFVFPADPDPREKISDPHPWALLHAHCTIHITYLYQVYTPDIFKFK